MVHFENPGLFLYLNRVRTIMILCCRHYSWCQRLNEDNKVQWENSRIRHPYENQRYETSCNLRPDGSEVKPAFTASVSASMPWWSSPSSGSVIKVRPTTEGNKCSIFYKQMLINVEESFVVSPQNQFDFFKKLGSRLNFDGVSISASQLIYIDQSIYIDWFIFYTDL
jgi:hypothetical protein